jgi:hypothetical protein
VFLTLRAVSRLAGCGLAGALAASCDPLPELSAPTELCVRERPQPPCRPAEQAEALLVDPGLRIEDARPTAGKQNAQVLTLLAPSGGQPVRFRAKWRALSTAHGLNDPRKEVAAHALQKLILRPEDWVLPPSAGHCFELEHYRRAIDAGAEPTFPGTRCVFGTLSYWLEHGRGLGEARKRGLLRAGWLLDPEAFARIPSYRRTLADTNLLAHLASNGDTHANQFVVTGSRRAPRVHLVDYTISFSDYRNPTLGFHDEWSIVHVPALAESSVAQLRAIELEQLEGLLVIEELESRSGLLVPTAVSRPIRRDTGVRWSGSRLQLGLTELELSRVWARLRALVLAVDRGELGTFRD